MLFHFACEAAGATGTRLSLRPLISRDKDTSTTRARNVPRECGCVSGIGWSARLSMSSLRTQGPITTGVYCCAKAVEQRLHKTRRGVWVPAFAGTTSEDHSNFTEFLTTAFAENLNRNLGDVLPKVTTTGTRFSDCALPNNGASHKEQAGNSQYLLFLSRGRDVYH
jgi:hypothetical protein